MKDVIIKEQVLNHSIDKVWNAISKQEEISSWFINADFKAEEGYRYSFKSKGEDCTEINGVVKEADPYTLIYTWVVQDTNVETTVKWELKKTLEGTALYLEHSGISNYSGETAITMFGHFGKGWENCFNLLTEYLGKEVHAR